MEQQTPQNGTPTVMTEQEVKNLKVVFSKTDKIILPERITKLQASEELKLQHLEEEKVVDKIKLFDEWEGDDAMVALMRTFKRQFGWINGQDTKSFWGDEPPREYKIQTDVNAHEDCFVGNLLVAAWDKAQATTGFSGGVAYIKVTMKRKFSDRFDAFIEAVHEELRSNSIYKNKCLILDGGLAFIENKGIDDIILNKSEQLVLDKFILKPILTKSRHKRGVLLSGVFGTGKTETGLKIGRIGVEHGQTFIYVKDRDLPRALTIAKRYQPAIILVEDLDEMAGGGRDEATNQLLNTIDGIETKGQALTILMTTNNKHNINPAFRRPGRIDVIMEFNLPEPATIEEMYRRFFAGFLGAENLDYVTLAGKTPSVQGAVIREISNRAKLLVEHGQEINDDHVESSIALAKMQIDFMKEPQTIKDESVDSQFTKLIDTRLVVGLDEAMARHGIRKIKK